MCKNKKIGGIILMLKTRVYNVHDLMRCWIAPRKSSETQNDMIYKGQLNLQGHDTVFIETDQLKTNWYIFK